MLLSTICLALSHVIVYAILSISADYPALMYTLITYCAVCISCSPKYSYIRYIVDYSKEYFFVLCINIIPYDYILFLKEITWFTLPVIHTCLL